MTGILTLVEKHIIKPSNKDYTKLDYLCFLSKNLYNSTLYAVRQHFFATEQFLTYQEVNRIFTHTKQSDYIALPAKVSKHTQQLVELSYKSFFSLHKKGIKAKIPHYLDKEKGRQVVHYEKGALSLVKNGWIKLSKTNIWIKTKVEKENIQFVRVVHKGNHIVLEVGYKKPKQPLKPKQSRFASLDAGLNNLATISSNVAPPIIINGRPLKSINHFYNKTLKKAKDKKTLALKRKNKISDYLHKSSRSVVNYLVSHNIDTLIIGKNIGWKQNINLGKVNNQNFVFIPFEQFFNQLVYKCELAGIEVIFQEESYTSKCSFLDNEPVEKHSRYLGKRVHRGLFVSQSGKTINADVNGSLNILKKHLTSKVGWNIQLWMDCLKVCSTPIRFSF